MTRYISKNFLNLLVMKKEVYKAIAVLVGTIIGAGVLGIPFAISRAGFLTGLAAIVLLGLVVLIINLSVGEIVLRTKGKHQLTGYAEKYLGKKGKLLMTLSMVFGITGALLAYIVGVGEALSVIFGVDPFWFSIGFFIIGISLIYYGIKSVSASELFLSSTVISLILVISVVAFFSGKMDFGNLTEFSLSKLFIPYGVILFAFIGAAAVPEMSEVLAQNKKEMKNAIIIGSLIPLFLYALFSFAIVGVFGDNVTEVATVGLGVEFGFLIVILANLFAVFAMTTSFLALGLALKEVYNYDYKLNPFTSWALACFVPVILFLFGFKSFVRILGTTGIFAGGIEGALIVFMLWVAKKKSERKPEYTINVSKLLGVALITVFALGIILHFT
jgi:tyrosine-specific transport protein